MGPQAIERTERTHDFILDSCEATLGSRQGEELLVPQYQRTASLISDSVRIINETVAVNGPRHDLCLAKMLVNSGEYDYDDGKSCMQVLLEQIDSMVLAVEFIKAAFAQVTPQDYCGTLAISTNEIRGTYDEYAFPVSEELLERFGLRKRNWYLKFKISEVRGQNVFVLSLHPLYKYESRRIAGPLRPQ